MNNIVIQDIYIRKNCIHNNTFTHLHCNLFYLQKKIYQASKECHVSLVQSLQKLLVSLSSIKILAYIKVQQKVTKSTIVYDNTYLYNNTASSLDLSIPIQKQITLWCLEPEWQPKIDFSRINQELNTVQYNSDHHNYLYSFTPDASYTKIQKKYIVAKLQTIRCIANAIKSFFDKNSFFQVTSCQLNNMFRNDNLYILIKCVLFNGISWNLFRQTMPTMKKSIHMVIFLEYLKKRIYVYQIDRLKLSNQQILLYLMYDLNFTARSIRCNKNWNIIHINFENKVIISKLTPWQNNLYKIYYNKLFDSLRDILFHKDKFGRVRTNTHLSISLASYKINKLIGQYKTYIALKVENYASQQINKQIRKTVYRWARKSYK